MPNKTRGDLNSPCHTTMIHYILNEKVEFVYEHGNDYISTADFRCGANIMLKILKILRITLKSNQNNDSNSLYEGWQDINSNSASEIVANAVS